MVTPAERAPRFLLTPAELAGPLAALTGTDLHHCRVLRLRPGDTVRLGDGRGREVAGTLRRLARDRAEVEVGSELRREAEPMPRVTLVQGLARGDKLDWTLQKATELGLHRFVPMASARSQVHPEEGGGRRRERWQEIARQAARQAERTFVPEVTEPCTFAQALDQVRAHDLAFLAYELAGPERAWRRIAPGLPRPASVALLVGPEGGFTPEEADQAASAGAIPVGLGPNVLRSETAGLIAVALALFTWGGLGGGA
jgi:16S rRNA (uracil1498-N3)-methyltransferase